jgi:SAM-dependent methyltransferase
VGDSHGELKARLRDQWAAISAGWIEATEAGATNRDGLLEPWMLVAVGDVSGLDVVDLGCGEGRYSRNAGIPLRVTGVDLNERFIEYARHHIVGDERYVLGDMEGLAGLADGAFDVAVSYVCHVTGRTGLPDRHPRSTPRVAPRRAVRCV